LALEYAERAIAAAPQPLPFLQDTKAKALLHQGKAGEALVVLEPIIKRWPQTDPRVYLHLALAYDRLGREAEAERALSQARERGLAASELTAGDRQWYDDLEVRLARLETSPTVEASLGE
jgi:predicted Zn-dependent protease